MTGKNWSLVKISEITEKVKITTSFRTSKSLQYFAISVSHVDNN